MTCGNEANGFDSKVVWEWDPRQTGNGIEPDLRGSVDGAILVFRRSLYIRKSAWDS
jgi:hypothetical protein